MPQIKFYQLLAAIITFQVLLLASDGDTNAQKVSFQEHPLTKIQVVE